MLAPLVERELRIALLRRKARHQWMSAAWTAGAITLFFMLILGLANRSSGRTLFRCLFGFAIGGVITRGFSLTADLFSEERRNGTLGLLVLTGLRPLQIFTSKLLGAGLLAAYGLLGGLPFFAIPFLAGGMAASQYLCAFAFLVNALLLCVAIGLLASVLHRDGGQAQLAAQALTGVLCVGTPLLHWLSFAPAGGLWLALSPAYAPYLIFTSFSRQWPRLFWFSSAITLGYSVLALVLAAVILQRTWRDGPQMLAPTGWRAHWRAWLQGGELWRRRVRARFLADQPFCWLAARDRSPVLLGYAILAGAALVWVVGWAAIGPRFLTPANSFICSIILHQVLNLVLAYAAGRRFAEERLSGSLEILLTAPLRAGDIVEGQSKALFAQFRLVGLIALLFDLVFCVAGLTVLTQKGLVSAAYLCAWVVMLVFWFALHLEAASRAMWISAWTARPGYAAMQATKSQLWWIVWVWMLSRGSFGVLFQSTGFSLFFFAIMLIQLLLAFAHRRLLRQKLTAELRQIACAPIPSRHDKRFKNWDPNKIFPPGRWGQMVLRPAKPAARMDTFNG